MKKITVEKKFSTVIKNNTFYFYNKKFEEKYEGVITSLKETLLLIRNQIETNGLKRDIFEKIIFEKENGLKAILALTGVSNETLKRLTTIIRVIDDEELNKLVNKEKWPSDDDKQNINEWPDSKIINLLKSNEYFRKGIVNLFFEGSTVPVLTDIIPLFELKKFSILKLKFEISELIDTIIRYREKGSYSGRKENNPELLIEKLLNKLKITFEKGDLDKLIDASPESKRTMDFIIPNKQKPIIIIECSYLSTTSSGQGDKSKTEINVQKLIKEHYPSAKFIGFVDGIGWYVRKEDLKRMVIAYEDVFTFNQSEIDRFEKLILELIPQSNLYNE